MSNQTIRPTVEAALGAQITDLEARKDLAQRISDYALGCNMSPVLSERLSTQYMYDHFGGLERPEPSDWNMLQEVEAYNIIFGEESAKFVVDRRSIFDKSQNEENYRQDKDLELINTALQKWFKENVFMKDRVNGTDNSMVESLVESKIELKYGIGACLKYGLLHDCIEFPHSLHNTKNGKPVFIEMYATLTNGPRMGKRYPYIHIWEEEELHFQMKAITYSDKEFLTVHMPGYG